MFVIVVVVVVVVVAAAVIVVFVAVVVVVVVVAVVAIVVSVVVVVAVAEAVRTCSAYAISRNVIIRKIVPAKHQTFVSVSSRLAFPAFACFSCL